MRFLIGVITIASTEKLIKIILRLDNQMSKGLKDASKDVDRFANRLNKAGDNMKSAIQGVGKNLNKMGKDIQGLGTKMTVGLTLPIVALGVGVFKTFGEFEDVMAELQARTGATEADMKRLGKVAKEMGRDTVFSATQAAEAMLELTASGSSAAEAMEQLPSILNLAAAGALDLGVAADGVTDVMKQFKLEVSDSVMITDDLARAAGSSSATIADLLQGFGNVGPVAAQFGLSVNETAAALAVFAENGIKGSEAGTQLRSMLLNMTRDTVRTQGTWIKLGVSMFDAAGEVRDINDVFVDLNAAMDGLPMEEQIKLGKNLAGNYGIIGFNSLRAANGISDMQAQMLNAASAGEVADARMNTLNGKVMSLKGSFETLAITLGGLGEGPLKGFITWATEAVNKMTIWAEANPVLAQKIMLVVAALAALGPVVFIFGTIVSAVGIVISVFGTLVGVVGTVASVISALVAVAPVLFTILAPLAAIPALIIVAIGALWLFASNWREIFTMVWMAAQLLVMGVQSLFVSMLQGILKAVAVATQLGSIIAVTILQGLTQAVAAATQLFQVLAITILQGLASAAVAATQLMATLGIIVMQSFLNFIAQWATNLEMLATITEAGLQRTDDAIKTSGKGWGASFKIAGELMKRSALHIIGIVQGLTSQIGTIMKALPAVMQAVATNIMQGLIDGIKSKLAEWLSVLRDMVGDTVSMVRNAFQIRSPSKVMAKLGAQVGEGFQVGLQSMGGIGVNVPQVTGVSASSSPSLGFSGASGGGVNIFIEKMVVPAGTTREQAIAVSREIGKLIKQRGGKNFL